MVSEDDWTDLAGLGGRLHESMQDISKGMHVGDGLYKIGGRFGLKGRSLEFRSFVRNACRASTTS